MHISLAKTLKSMFSTLLTFHRIYLSELCCKIMIQVVAVEMLMPELNKIASHFCAWCAQVCAFASTLLYENLSFPLHAKAGGAKLRCYKNWKKSENGCCCCCCNIIILTKGVGHIALVILFKYNMFQFKSEFGSWIAINGKCARWGNRGYDYGLPR